MKNKKKGIMSKKKIVKGKPLTIWIVCIIVISIFISFGSGLIAGKLLFEKKEKKCVTSTADLLEDSYSIDDEQFIDLADMAFLYDENYSLFFNPLLSLNGYTTSLNNDQLIMIAYKYASKRGLVTTVTGEEYQGCLDGAGVCNGVNISDFKNILRKYNINYYDASNLNIYNDMYIFNFGGDTIAKIIKHNLQLKCLETECFITDKMNLESVDGQKKTTKIKEYTFKKYDDGTFYLYSVFDK